MDVSNRAEEDTVELPGGQQLLETVVTLTGLPQPWAPQVREELGEILQNAGVSSGTCTLDELRSAMLAYLESIEESVQASYAESAKAEDSFPEIE